MRRYFAALAATARRDLLVKAAVLFYLAGGIASTVFERVWSGQVSGDSPWLVAKMDNVGELLLVAMTIASVLWRRTELVASQERAFWRRVMVGYCCWLLGAVLRLAPQLVEPLPDRPFRVILYASFYVFMIRAIEGEPHRPPRPFKTAVERLLTWPAVTFFVLGLVVYFAFVPVSLQWSTLREGTFAFNRREVFYIYTILDIYLSVRFLFLAQTARSRRWRSIYMTLAVPWILFVFFTDLAYIAEQARFHWPLAALPRWWEFLPFVIQLLAVRLRHHPFPGEWSSPEQESPVPQSDELTFVVSARTLALGVVFPVVHILVTRYHLVSDPGHNLREVLVLAWLVFFGVVALVQHRHLERRGQELWLERVAFEEALRTSEKDLRLIIERGRASEMLHSVEAKFDLIFRSCPYTLVISSLRDGRFIEVNPAFEETFGYSKSEVVGRSIDEVGLWIEPETTDRLSEEVGSRRSVREVEIRFQTRAGDDRVALVCATKIEAGGESCLLSIVHDVTERKRAERWLELGAELLDRAQAAIFEVDGEGRIRSWNRGAERISGWRAEEAVGRHVRDVVRPRAAADAVLATEDREWTGEHELAHRGGQGVRVLGWCCPVSGKEGSKLVVSRPNGPAV